MTSVDGARITTIPQRRQIAFVVMFMQFWLTSLLRTCFICLWKLRSWACPCIAVFELEVIMKLLAWDISVLSAVFGWW